MKTLKFAFDIYWPLQTSECNISPNRRISWKRIRVKDQLVQKAQEIISVKLQHQIQICRLRCLESPAKKNSVKLLKCHLKSRHLSVMEIEVCMYSEITIVHSAYVHIAKSIMFWFLPSAKPILNSIQALPKALVKSFMKFLKSSALSLPHSVRFLKKVFQKFKCVLKVS